ncbi:unnamed protein product [Rotaria sp. Silwood1]|nr:unnamed protein product [Rotaria sp. Silwood1]CAF3974777.1 unnamed protein product [Rotaria sp. Silwood1]CAF5003887.1 unnamed protein product [Rotaria sp. Silwood1]
MAATTEIDSQNADKLDPSYMYSQLFKEFMLEINEDDTKPLNDLVSYCRSQGISETELKNFQREYHQKSPIWCYTSAVSVRSMLDQALQCLNMETMTKMGFFIRSLHRQLEQLYNEQSSTHMKPFIVFRGQEYSQNNFQELLTKKGGILSFNNFLVTSTQKEVAMEYVQHALHEHEDHVGVIFIMTIDPSKVSIPTVPFALIDKHSANPQQREILFSTHTVFRVDEIKQMAGNNRLWEVQLTLTAANDSEMAALTEALREHIDGTGWNRIAQLMLKVGQFDLAEQIYNNLLNK